MFGDKITLGVFSVFSLVYILPDIIEEELLTYTAAFH